MEGAVDCGEGQKEGRTGMIGWFIILSVLDTAFFIVLVAMYFVMHDDVNTMRKKYLELYGKN